MEFFLVMIGRMTFASALLNSPEMKAKVVDEVFTPRPLAKALGL